MRTIKVKGLKPIDLNNPKDVLEYLIYMSSDLRRMIFYSLRLCPRESSLSDFRAAFYDEKDNSGRYSLCLYYSAYFYDTFINSSGVFTFNDYFFRNPSNTDREKMSKLNTSIKNLEKLLEKLSAQIKIVNFNFPTSIGELNRKSNEIDHLFEEFKIKDQVIMKSHRDHYYTDNKYHFHLLLFFFGIRINSIINKLKVDYSGFIETKKIESKENNNIDTTDLPNRNPYPRIFIDRKSFYFFENLKDSLCQVKRTELADNSYVFRKMQADGLIHPKVSESEFREFLFLNYEINLGKLKILEYCSTSNKDKIYNLTKG